MMLMTTNKSIFCLSMDPASKLTAIFEVIEFDNEKIYNEFSTYSC